jgi:hypothetical protein
MTDFLPLSNPPKVPRELRTSRPNHFLPSERGEGGGLFDSWNSSCSQKPGRWASVAQLSCHTALQRPRQPGTMMEEVAIVL